MTKIKTYPMTLEYKEKNIKRLAELAKEYNATMSEIANVIIEEIYNYNENLKKSEKKRKYHKNH